MCARSFHCNAACFVFLKKIKKLFAYFHLANFSFLHFTIPKASILTNQIWQSPRLNFYLDKISLENPDVNSSRRIVERSKQTQDREARRRMRAMQMRPTFRFDVKRAVCTGHKDRIDKSPPRRESTRTIGSRCRKWQESSAVLRHRSINPTIYERATLFKPFHQHLTSLSVSRENSKEECNCIPKKMENSL